MKKTGSDIQPASIKNAIIKVTYGDNCILAEIKTENRFKKEKIFFLTGGFCAGEYTFSLDEEIKIIK